MSAKLVRCFVVLSIAGLFGAVPAGSSAQGKDAIVFKDTNPDFHLGPNEYRKLITELAIAVSPSVMAPAETLGVHGFEFGLEARNAFIHGGEPYWTKVARDGSAPLLLFMPTARIRKGLPFSFEIDSTVTHLPFSGGQNVITGGGRFAAHEGFELVPDLTLSANYAWLLGNPYLRLGVFQWSAALGYTWALGPIKELKTATFSPFIAYAQLYVDSQVLAVRNTGGFSRNTTNFTSAAGLPADGSLRLNEFRGNRPDKWVIGFQAHTGRVSVLLSTELVDSGIPTFNVRLGSNF